MKRTSRTIGYSLFIILMIFGLWLPFVSPAHANASIVQDQHGSTTISNGCSNSGSTTVTITATTINNILVVGQNDYVGAPTGGGVTTWNTIATLAGVVGNVNIQMYWGTITSSSTTITVRGCSWEMWEVSGLPSPTWTFQKQSVDPSSTSATLTTPTVSPAAGDTVFAFGAMLANLGTCPGITYGSVTSGFTNGAGTGECNTTITTGLITQYVTTWTTGTTTGSRTASCAAGCNDLEWGYVIIDGTPGIVTITVTQTLTAIAVTPCTAFELGCWLYPAFTILMVAVVVIGEARFIKVPKADYTGLFLEGSAMGGLICVLFGILNVMVPVIILLMQILRAIAK